MQKGSDVRQFLYIYLFDFWRGTAFTTICLFVGRITQTFVWFSWNFRSRHNGLWKNWLNLGSLGLQAVQPSWKWENQLWCSAEISKLMYLLLTGNNIVPSLVWRGEYMHRSKCRLVITFHMSLVVKTKCILVTCICVPCRIPTLLHGPRCNLGNGRGAL